MKPYENLIKTIKETSSSDVKSAFDSVVSGVQNGKLLEDPNLMLALGLLGSAGVILTVCLCLFFFRRSSNSFDPNNLYTLESRLHTLEITIQEQKNLIGALKSQQKADFLYMKQEIKQMGDIVADLEDVSFDSAPTLGVAVNS